MPETSVLPTFDLVGNGYDLGRQHGTHLRKVIRAFANDGLFRLNHILWQPTSLQELTSTLQDYHHVLVAQVPQYVEEIRGLADGAKISYEEALLLQIRREVLGYSRLTTRGDCTTFARNNAAECVLGQTIDLNGNLENESYVLRISRVGHDGRAVVLLTFTGLLG